jgi:membrane protein
VGGTLERLAGLLRTWARRVRPPAHSPVGRALRVAVTLLRVTRATTRNYLRHHVPVAAAAVSFFSLLSFAPFMLVVGAVAAACVGRSDVGAREVVSMLRELVPVAEDEGARLLHELVNTSIQITGLSFVFLLWTASSAFNVTYEAVCRAGHIPARFVRRRLVSAAMVLVPALLAMAMFLVESVVPSAGTFSLEHLDEGAFGGQATRMAALCLALGLLYKLVAGRALVWRHALAAGAVCAPVWVLGRFWFWRTVASNLERGALYGALTTTIMVLLWVYYAACIVLAGAELAFVLERTGMLTTRRDDLPEEEW